MENRTPVKLSLENARLIGTGFNSNVYQLDEDKIVKVLHGEGASFAEAAREATLSRKAFIRGVPTAISYDIAEVDGKPALVYEFFECRNLKDTIQNDPENFETYVRKYAELLRQLHTTDAGDMDAPDCREQEWERLECLRGRLTDGEYDKLKKMLDAIPRAHTFVHGDCHGNNVKVFQGELYFIDLDTLSFGNPIYEFAGYYVSAVAFYEVDAESQAAFMMMPKELSVRIFDRMLDHYFAPLPQDAIERNKQRITLLGLLHFYHWNVAYGYDLSEQALAWCLPALRRCLTTVDDLILEMP